jgi:hypothetical protein
LLFLEKWYLSFIVLYLQNCSVKNIAPKFKLGQKVWFLLLHHPYEGIVTRVYRSVRKPGLFMYEVTCVDGHVASGGFNPQADSKLEVKAKRFNKAKRKARQETDLASTAASNNAQGHIAKDKSVAPLQMGFRITEDRLFADGRRALAYLIDLQSLITPNRPHKVSDLTPRQGSASNRFNPN